MTVDATEEIRGKLVDVLKDILQSTDELDQWYRETEVGKRRGRLARVVINKIVASVSKQIAKAFSDRFPMLVFERILNEGYHIEAKLTLYPPFRVSWEVECSIRIAGLKIASLTLPFLLEIKTELEGLSVDKGGEEGWIATIEGLSLNATLYVRPHPGFDRVKLDEREFPLVKRKMELRKKREEKATIEHA